MSALAPTLEAFFVERLGRERRVSPHTVASYRDTWRLLLEFSSGRLGRGPSDLDFCDLDAAMISAFLDHLEKDRGNTVRTRNARLSAVRATYRYAALRHPEHASLIQRVLAIPEKRHEKRDISFLAADEVDALLGAPDLERFEGRRDQALLVLAIQTGLRVSELIGLNCEDVHLGGGPYVRCVGKGRKERCTPLTATTIAVLRRWFTERGGGPREPLFCTRSGRRLSRDAVEARLAKHASTATSKAPSLRERKLSPHVLRHTCAMQLLASGVDAAVIALWLGHEDLQSTQMYLHADMALKERALERTTPPHTKPGRFKPKDALLAFLEGL